MNKNQDKFFPETYFDVPQIYRVLYELNAKALKDYLTEAEIEKPTTTLTDATVMDYQIAKCSSEIPTADTYGPFGCAAKEDVLYLLSTESYPPMFTFIKQCTEESLPIARAQYINSQQGTGVFSFENWHTVCGFTEEQIKNQSTNTITANGHKFFPESFLDFAEIAIIRKGFTDNELAIYLSKGSDVYNRGNAVDYQIAACKDERPTKDEYGAFGCTDKGHLMTLIERGFLGHCTERSLPIAQAQYCQSQQDGAEFQFDNWNDVCKFTVEQIKIDCGASSGAFSVEL